ncbi:hypothetical protein [Saccharopolyspora gregorii]|uniref:Uncharacterized protein n=1 Tax=Saccharopolyspora gregorii TaxID=33914 RepID=A0ABP6S2W3_9PSEU
MALDGSLDIAGNDVRVKVIAVLSLLNGQLTIEPKKLDIADQALSDIPLGDVFEKSILQSSSPPPSTRACCRSRCGPPRCGV